MTFFYVHMHHADYVKKIRLNKRIFFYHKNVLYSFFFYYFSIFSLFLFSITIFCFPYILIFIWYALIRLQSLISIPLVYPILIYFFFLWMILYYIFFLLYLFQNSPSRLIRKCRNVIRSIEPKINIRCAGASLKMLSKGYMMWKLLVMDTRTSIYVFMFLYLGL